MSLDDRKTLLSAASVLLKNFLFDSDGKYRGISWDPAQKMGSFDLEQILEDNLAKAQKELDSFRESRGFRMALDAMLPGWFDIDVSDQIPGNCFFFVSNDPQEWFDWMIQHGINEKTAKKLLSEVGHPLREGAS